MSPPAPRWRRELARLAVLGGSRAAAAALGFLAMLQLAPAAGPAVLGQWGVLLAVQGWALHLAECGLRSVVTAEAARAAGGPCRLLATYLGLRLLLASAVTAVSLLGAALFAPAPLRPLALVLTSLFAIALQLDWLALVTDRPVVAGALLLVRPAAWCLLLALAEGPLDLDRLAALFALAWALAALASWPLVRTLPARAEGEPPPPAGRLLRRGLPLALVTLSSQAMLSVDLVLVGRVFGAERAGGYYLAVSLVVAGLVVANAANQIAIARIGAIRDEPAAARAELRRQLALATAVGTGLAAAGAVLAPPLVPWLFGPAFEPAVALFLALLPWLVLQHPSAVLQGALTGARGERALLHANLTMAAALALALGAALAAGSVPGCALARAAAEAVRLVMLARAARATFSAPHRKAVAEHEAMATLKSAAARVA